MNTAKNLGQYKQAISCCGYSSDSYFDESLTKIGGVVNYGVCARDHPRDFCGYP